jgi:hypothetical protein
VGSRLSEVRTNRVAAAPPILIFQHKGGFLTLNLNDMLPARPRRLECARFINRRFPFSVSNLIEHQGRHIIQIMKTVDFNRVKRQESRSRMAALREARRGPQSATKVQQRASLVGNGAKWRIINLKQVVSAMSKWA